jgi:hypothetical protein
MLIKQSFRHFCYNDRTPSFASLVLQCVMPQAFMALAAIIIEEATDAWSPLTFVTVTIRRV